MEIKEKHDVTYSCGCVHQIVLFESGGFWQATENNKDCEHHKEEK